MSSEKVSLSEYVQRFTDYLVSVAGEFDSAGNSVREYGSEVAPTYYWDDDFNEFSPEDAASEDLREWEVA